MRHSTEPRPTPPPGLDPSESDYVSVPRAARVLGVAPKLMHQLLDGGAIRFTVPHRQRRVRLGDVEQFRRQRERRGQLYAPRPCKGELDD